MTCLQWLHFPQISSTHLFAKQHAEQLIEAKIEKGGASSAHITALITCDQQTGGIGRRGNRWHSQSGDLLATYLIQTQTKWLVELSGQIALRAALALFDALAIFLGASIDDIWIKWPNDLYLHDQKIAGVMVEQLNDGAMALVSFGADLAAGDRMDRARRSFIKLCSSGQQICNMRLAKELTGSLTKQFQELYHNGASTLSPHYFGYRLIEGALISFRLAQKGERQRAIYRGIDRHGRLIASWKNKIAHFSSEQICQLKIESH